MLKGEAEMQASVQGDLPATKEGIIVGKKRKQAPVTLADRLKEIFGLEEPEEVISGAFSSTSITIRKDNNSVRISLLVSPDCTPFWIYVPDPKAYLLLCIPSEELRTYNYDPPR
jgi:hypothetical protein